MKKPSGLFVGLMLILASIACGAGSTTDPIVDEPTQPPATAVPEEASQPTEGETGDNITIREQFEQDVIRMVVERDYEAMPAVMRDPFTIGGWRAGASERSPADAVEQLKTFYPPNDGIVTFGPNASVDLEAKLGTPPEEFFDGGVSFLYSVGWGENGNGEAILVIKATDEGVLHWSMILVALNGFDDAQGPSQPAEGETGDNITILAQFEQDVIRAVVDHDYAAMQSFMLDSFTIAGWQAGASEWGPADAIEQLKTYYSEDGFVTFGGGQNVDLASKLGSPPEEFFGGGLSFLYSVGWGPNGNGEAILVIKSTDEGVLYWSSILIALDRFD